MADVVSVAAYTCPILATDIDVAVDVPDTVSDANVPTDVKLDETTFDASVVPVNALAAPVAGVYPSASVTLPLVRDNVPPSVKLPDVVTEPVNVSPLTVPVPATDVTVPVFVVYPDGLVALYGVYVSASVTSLLVSVIAPVRVLKLATPPIGLPFTVGSTLKSTTPVARETVYTKFDVEPLSATREN